VNPRPFRMKTLNETIGKTTNNGPSSGTTVNVSREGISISDLVVASFSKWTPTAKCKENKKEGQSLTEEGKRKRMFFASLKESKELFRIAENEDLVEAVHEFGWRPIHVAAANANLQAVESLLSRKVDVHAKDKFTSAYEMTTRDRRSADDYEWFGDAMAVMRVREKEFARNLDSQITNFSGFTALHYAVLSNSPSVVETLLRAGSDVKATSDKGQTPLDLAKSRGLKEMTSLLENSSLLRTKNRGGNQSKNEEEDAETLKRPTDERRLTTNSTTTTTTTTKKDVQAQGNDLMIEDTRDEENVLGMRKKKSKEEEKEEEEEEKENRQEKKKKKIVKPKKDIKEILESKLIGQRYAVEQVSGALRRWQYGWWNRQHPFVLLFLGSSGVGKTEMAKEVATFLRSEFGREYVRLDMSEFQEKHSVSKLIGAPPGYVGHDVGAFLTKELKRIVSADKQCVILLDEKKPIRT